MKLSLFEVAVVLVVAAVLVEKYKKQPVYNVTVYYSGQQGET